jgi:tetratricopeptide (TPR) repeat protein
MVEQASEGAGPVMVLGLERAVPMGSDHAPILRTLNMERAEWPERLPRPVVFWIPEALLGALSRSAPDFMDWRSDTIYFPSQSEAVDRELYTFDSFVWRGGLDGRMPEIDRRARVEELRSRLRTTPRGDDPVVEKLRGGWRHELGNHLLFLGEFATAEECFRESLAVAEELGFCGGIAASYHHLAMVAERRGSLQEAAEWCRRSLAILEEVRDDGGMINSYNLLGAIAYRQRAMDEAVEWFRKSLAISEETGDRLGVAMAYHNLGMAAQSRGSLDEAFDWFQKALAINEELGDTVEVARTISVIGILVLALGCPEDSVALHIRSFAIRWKLGSWELSIDTALLRRGREALREEPFRKLVEEHAETPEIAAAILEVAEAPADYGTGGRFNESADV